MATEEPVEASNEGMEVDSASSSKTTAPPPPADAVNGDVKETGVTAAMEGQEGQGEKLAAGAEEENGDDAKMDADDDDKKPIVSNESPEVDNSSTSSPPVDSTAPIDPVTLAKKEDQEGGEAQQNMDVVVEQSSAVKPDEDSQAAPASSSNAPSTGAEESKMEVVQEEGEDKDMKPAVAPAALTGPQLIAHIAEGQAGLIKEQTIQLRSLIRAMANVSWGECQNPPGADLLYKRRPKAKTDQVSVIDGLEVQLIQVLDSRGRVSRVKDVDVIIDLMLQATRDETKALLLEVIRTSMDEPCLERLVASGGMTVLKHWLIGFDKETHWDLLRLLLETLKILPATFEGLKSSNLGKVLNRVKKEKLKGEMKTTHADKERMALGRLAEAVKEAYKEKLAKAPKPVAAPTVVKKKQPPVKSETDQQEAVKSNEGGGREAKEGGDDDVEPANLPKLVGLESSMVVDEPAGGAAGKVKKEEKMDTTGGGGSSESKKSTTPSSSSGQKKRPATTAEGEAAITSQISTKKKTKLATRDLSPPLAVLPALPLMKTASEAIVKRRVTWRDEEKPGATLVEIKIFEPDYDDEEEGMDMEGVTEGGGEGGLRNRKDRLREMAIEERKHFKKDAKKEDGGGGISKAGDGTGGSALEKAQAGGGGGTSTPTITTRHAWKVPRQLVTKEKEGGQKKQQTAETARIEVQLKGRYEMVWIRDSDIPPNPGEDSSTVRAPVDGYIVLDTSQMVFYQVEELAWAEGRVTQNIASLPNQHQLQQLQQQLQQQQQQQQQQSPPPAAAAAQDQQVTNIQDIPPWLFTRLTANNNELLRLCTDVYGRPMTVKLQQLSSLIQAADRARLDEGTQIRLCRDLPRFFPCVRGDGSMDLLKMQQALIDQDAVLAGARPSSAPPLMMPGGGGGGGHPSHLLPPSLYIPPPGSSSSMLPSTSPSSASSPAPSGGIYYTPREPSKTGGGSGDRDRRGGSRDRDRRGGTPAGGGGGGGERRGGAGGGGSGKMKTVQCSFFKEGRCTRGASCTFLHGEENPSRGGGGGPGPRSPRDRDRRRMDDDPRRRERSPPRRR